MTRTLLFAVLVSVAGTVSAQRLRPPPDALYPPAMIYQTLEMQHGTTIDFADFTQHQVGPLRAYIYIKVQGELMVIPAYHPVADETIWRAPRGATP